jgi:hypothetical protein
VTTRAAPKLLGELGLIGEATIRTAAKGPQRRPRRAYFPVPVILKRSLASTAPVDGSLATTRTAAVWIKPAKNSDGRKAAVASQLSLGASTNPPAGGQVKPGASKPKSSGMLTMSNVTRTGEALLFVINADLIVSVPTARVPKLSVVGATLKMGGLATAVGAAAAATIASVKMSRFIPDPFESQEARRDCCVFAPPRQGRGRA